MEIDADIFLCHQCGKTFNKLSTMESHSKWKHSEKTEFICELCGRIFQKKYNLQKHMQTGIHFMTETVNCAVQDCGFKSMNRKIMGNHYERYHGISLKETTEYFNSFDEFWVWKTELERKTRSRFVKMSSSRIKKDGCMKSTYFCHRDGNFIPKGKNLRNLKLKGSNKINAHCPAKIDVEVGEKLVVASYIITHLGHDLDIARMSLDITEKALIARKLSMKVPFEDILNEVNSAQQSPDSGSKRVNMVTRKDLWNIVDTFKLNPKNIVFSRNRVKRKKSISELKNVQKGYQALRLQPHSMNQGKVIYSLSNTKGNQINKNIILMQEADGETVGEYALVSEDDDVEEGRCLIVNDQGELESEDGHQIIYTNEEGEVICEESEVSAISDNVPVILDVKTETSECEMSVVEDENGEVVENISWDDIVYIDGEAYRIERNEEGEEEAVLTDETQSDADLPTDVTASENGGVLQSGDDPQENDQTKTSEHFVNTSAEAFKIEEEDGYKVVVEGFDESEVDSHTIVSVE